MYSAEEISQKLGKILIVGGGHMGTAILAGLISSSVVASEDVVVANPGKEKRDNITATYGVACVADSSEVEESPDTCILAVKPQILREVIAKLASEGLENGKAFAPKRIISIAAGITTQTILQYFPESFVIRAMPNTPLMVGKGMVGLSAGEGTPNEEAELAKQMFECMGSAVVVDESMQDAVVALSGSGPAYFALFVDELAKAGVKLGLPEDKALELSLETMIGAGELLKQTGQSPAQLVEGACTPGGTTIAALDALKADGISKAIEDCAFACAKRSKELS